MINNHPDFEQANRLLNLASSENRPLTKDEYRQVKALEYYYQSQFWEKHLTPSGFTDYRNLLSQGKNGKYLGYLKLWELYNTPLMKALE